MGGDAMSNWHEEDDDDLPSCDVATPPSRGRGRSPGRASLIICGECGKTGGSWFSAGRPAVCAACYVRARQERPTRQDMAALADEGVELADAFLRRVLGVSCSTQASQAAMSLRAAIDFAAHCEALFRAEREILEAELRRLQRSRA